MGRTAWLSGVCLGLALACGGARGEGAADRPPGADLVAQQAQGGAAPPTAPAAPAAPPEAVETAAATPPAPPSPTEAAGIPRSTAPEMLGDQPPLPFPFPQLPINPGRPNQPGATAALVPGVRGTKIADNESPRPTDRVYFSFNFWDDLNESANRRLGSDLHDQRAFRETFGLEKTFLDGDASLGLRLPLNTLDADSSLPGRGVASTDVGDLAVILKYALWQDRATGDLLSAGLLVTAPTGPGSFAGAGRFTGLHEAALQPFLGYVWNRGDFYLHGFLSVDVPTDARDVTLLSNDVGAGYFLYRSDEPDRPLTALVPTVEVHVNTPLNHRGVLGSGDPAGTPDWVDLTVGTNVELYRRARLAVGVVTPLTGPKPFDFEVLAQFRLSF